MGILSLVVAPDKMIAKYIVPDTPRVSVFREKRLLCDLAVGFHT